MTCWLCFISDLGDDLDQQGDDSIQSWLEGCDGLQQGGHMSLRDFETQVVDKLLSPNRESLKLNCKSAAPIEWGDSISPAYRKVQRDRMLGNWGWSQGNEFEVRDFEPEGPESGHGEMF